jgi:type VI secretion system protein ImpG
VRGTEVRLVVDEENFVGTGLSLFAAVLDRFFGLYVHINSFTQLTVISSRSKQALFKCLPRNGATALV